MGQNDPPKYNIFDVSAFEVEDITLHRQKSIQLPNDARHIPEEGT
jgi:hypothetical protein